MTGDIMMVFDERIKKGFRCSRCDESFDSIEDYENHLPCMRFT